MLLYSICYLTGNSFTKNIWTHSGSWEIKDFIGPWKVCPQGLSDHTLEILFYRKRGNHSRTSFKLRPASDTHLNFWNDPNKNTQPTEHHKGLSLASNFGDESATGFHVCKRDPYLPIVFTLFCAVITNSHCTISLSLSCSISDSPTYLYL